MVRVRPGGMICLFLFLCAQPDSQSSLQGPLDREKCPSPFSTLQGPTSLYKPLHPTLASHTSNLLDGVFNLQETQL